MFKEPAPSPEGNNQKPETARLPVDNFELYQKKLTPKEKESIHELIQKTLEESETKQTDGDAAKVNYLNHKEDLNNLYPKQDNSSPYAELYETVNFNAQMEQQRLEAAEQFENLASDLEQEIARIDSTDYETAIKLLEKQKEELLKSKLLHTQQLSALERQFNYESRPEYHVLYVTQKTEGEQVSHIDRQIASLKSEQNSKDVFSTLIHSYKDDAEKLRSFNPQLN